jgi:predicted transcriptional regulator
VRGLRVPAGDGHPYTTNNTKLLKPMHKKVEIEIDNETLTKLDKLAAQTGETREDLVAKRIREEVHKLLTATHENALESANA